MMMMREVRTSKRARGIAALAEIQNEQTMRRVKAKQRPSPFPSAAEAKAGGSTNRHAESGPSESSAFGLQFVQTKTVITPPQLAHEVDGESSGSDDDLWGQGEKRHASKAAVSASVDDQHGRDFGSDLLESESAHRGGHDSPGSDGAGRISEQSTLTFQTAKGSDYGLLIAQNKELLGQATETREVREMIQRIAAEEAADIEARQKKAEERRLAREAKSAEESAQLNVTRNSLRPPKPTADLPPPKKRASSGDGTGGTKRQKVPMVVPRLLSGPLGLVSFFGLALVEVLDKGDCLFLAVLAAALLIDSFEASRPYDSSTVAELVIRLRMHACELAQRLFEQNKADPLWEYVKLGLATRLGRDPTTEDLAQRRAQITSELVELQLPGTWNKPSLEFVTWALADFLKREIVVLTVLDNDGLGDNYRLYGCREGCHVRPMDELKTALNSVDDAPLVIVLQGGCHFSALVPKESCGIDTRRRSRLLLELGLLNSSVNTGNAARRRVAIAEGGAGTVSASTGSESTVSARTVSASSVQSRTKPAFPAFDALNTAPAVRPSAAAAPIDNTAEVNKQLRRQLAAAKRMLARVDTVIDYAATSSGIPIGGEGATRTLEHRLNFVNRVSKAAATGSTRKQRIKVSLGSTELQPSDCWETAPDSSELGRWRTRVLKAIQAHVNRELLQCSDALLLSKTTPQMVESLSSYLKETYQNGYNARGVLEMLGPIIAAIVRKHRHHMTEDRVHRPGT